LPSLREIIFEGLGAHAYYQCNPIIPLINERLYGPKPVSTLSSKAKVESIRKGSDYQYPSHPIALECLKLYSPVAMGHRDLPLMLASTLVHLTLGEIRVD
ncbi:hypothetical protein GGH93_005333, partial [Coemansia aciculifera]